MYRPGHPSPGVPSGSPSTSINAHSPEPYSEATPAGATAYTVPSAATAKSTTSLIQSKKIGLSGSDGSTAATDTGVVVTDKVVVLDVEETTTTGKSVGDETPPVP
jgi:hypothetical protein